jgi:glutaredoxin 3
MPLRLAARPCAPPLVRSAPRRPRSRARPANAAAPPPGGDAPATLGRRAFEAAGAWLVAHPAPQWMVTNPVKTWITTRAAGAYDVAATRAELDALLADDVVLFSATYCPFSARAKYELAQQCVPFTVHETNVMPNGRAIVAELGARTGGRTSIPHLWIAGVSIGGCNDGTPGLRPLIASGGLEDALARCSPDFQARRKALLAARDGRA